MKCGFCGHTFDAADAQSGCEACPMSGGCGMVRCPRCGYEMPPEAKLVTWLRSVRARLDAKRSPARHTHETHRRTDGSIE